MLRLIYEDYLGTLNQNIKEWHKLEKTINNNRHFCLFTNLNSKKKMFKYHHNACQILNYALKNKYILTFYNYYIIIRTKYILLSVILIRNLIFVVL